MTSVSVEALSVRYEGGAAVLEGVSLDVRDGELFFLLGPSGCGKTTLLRTIAGFVEPAAGRIRFGERDVTRVPPAKRDCGMVFQNYALWPHLTVFENVAFGLDVRKVKGQEKRDRVREALRLVRMEGFEDRPPNRLSGGQQQRVALARALVVEPSVLLLDEPLSNLDAALRVELRAEIREIQRRTRRTAVYVTHDRAEALALADRMAILRGGRIEQLGTPAEVYDEPLTPFVAGFVGDVNGLKGRVTGGAGDAGLRVEGPFGELAARVPRGTNGFAAGGGDASILVRPERLRLLPAGPAAAGLLPGRVLRSTFLGELLQHEVEVGGGAVLRALSLGGGIRPQEGESVRLAVDDALVYPLRACSTDAKSAAAASKEVSR